jgi:predicted ATPase/class 3 adenylate cyclase
MRCRACVPLLTVANHDALPTGAVTFLFSDIEGSTVMVRRLGADWGAVLSRQRVLCRAAWVAHGGHEMGTEGDSFFVVFASAAQAVAAAVAAQRAVGAEAWPEGGEVRIRVGLHSGPGHRHEDGYVGLDVHTGARVAATAHGGQVVVSMAVAEQARSELADVGLSFVDLGEHALKDLPERLRLFQVAAEGLHQEFPPLRSRGGPDHIPALLTTTIGREDDVANLRALLEEGVRLLTLTGPGGSGKTHLSLALAHQLVQRPADGVHFVPLATQTSAEGVRTEVARVLGVKDDADLLEYLESREMVLFLDNLEQVPDAGHAIRSMLERAQRLAVVITSRRPLHTPGEHEYPVRPLPLPDPATSDVDAIAESAAVGLFCDHAARARPGFVLSETNAEDVAALCAAVDGLPLGIELLAARSRLFSPAALRSRLDSVPDLTHTDTSRDTRQHSLRAAVAWSYDLLSVEAREVLDTMGVFAASASYDAVAAVLEATGVTMERDLPDVLFELVDASLVRVQEQIDGDPSFGLLVTVQRFARDRLHASGAGPRAESAHAQHYYGLIAAVPDMFMDGRPAKPTFDRHAAELDAIFERLPVAVQDPNWYDTSAVPVLHVAALFMSCARDAEREATSRRWATAVLQAAHGADDCGRAAMLLYAGAEADEATHARLLLSEAERLCAQALAREQRPHLPPWVDPGLVAADVLSARTILELSAGDLDAADAAVDRLRVLEGVRNDLRVRRLRLFNAWRVAEARGDLTAARQNLHVLADIAVNARARVVAAYGLASLDLKVGRRRAAQERLAARADDVLSGVDTWLLVGVARTIARSVAPEHPGLAARTESACVARLEAEGIPDDEIVDPPSHDQAAAWRRGRTEQVPDLIAELAALPPVPESTGTMTP